MYQTLKMHDTLYTRYNPVYNYLFWKSLSVIRLVHV